MDPLAGDRIVVRYRLGEGGPGDWRPAPNPALERSPSLSDLTGILVDETADALLVERDGTVERLPRAAITSIRQLSRRVVRNSAIRDVERVLTEAAPAAERDEFDGWTVSADPESTALRANTAVPLGREARAADVGRVRDWYTRRGLSARVVVPERLLRTAEIAPRPGTEYEVLVDDAGAAVEVPGDDRDARRSWRARGYGLHHTFQVLEL
ncbi:GNAT family N-acetyltransferase, cg3035/Rv0428c family [Gordonia sp. FQ]|uniref:GNAT family N-acetyltransferase, cg3035/Rv0428c family n=1 Tax=Gordonia sp. FQ TaxID=3446634 RepID=UPI003F82A3F8